MTHVTLVKSRISFLGGLEKTALSIAKSFVKKGCTVTILTTGKPPPKIKDIEIVTFGKLPKWGYFAIHSFHRACKNWLKTHPTDLIFGLDRTSNLTHYRAGNGAHRIFLKRKKCSRIKSWFSLVNPKDLLILKMEKKIFESSKLKILFTNSQMVREELLQEYHIDPKKIKVVFNGIDFNKFTLTNTSALEAKKKLGLNPDKRQLLFIGNNYKRKGVDFILKALSTIKSDTFELIVVGKEKYTSTFKMHAKKLGLSSQVFFFGSQTDLIPFYLAADCFVLPTNYDPFASVTLEALAMGLFVITSPYNGAKEIISEGCGEVLPNLIEHEYLANLLNKIIDKELPKLSKNQIRDSVRAFDSDLQLEKIMELSLKHV